MSNNFLFENQAFTLDTLKDLSPECIKVNCDSYIQKKLGSNCYCVELIIYCPEKALSKLYSSHRVFSEFKELFENFTKKNPTEFLPEFPSRISFSSSKDDDRMKYFNMFLNYILETSKKPNKKDECLEMIYNFIINNKDTTINIISKEKLKKFFNIDIPEEKKEEVNKVNNDKVENSPEEINKNPPKQRQSSNNLKFDPKILKKENVQVKKDDPPSVSKIEQIKRGAFGFVSKRFSSFLGKDKDKTKEKAKEPEVKVDNKKEKRNTVVEEKKVKQLEDVSEWKNILVKTSLKDYTPNIVRIKERCMQLYHMRKFHMNHQNEDDNNFYLIIPLYKINIEIFRYIYQANFFKKPKEEEKNPNPTTPNDKNEENLNKKNIVEQKNEQNLTKNEIKFEKFEEKIENKTENKIENNIENKPEIKEEVNKVEDKINENVNINNELHTEDNKKIESKNETETIKPELNIPKDNNDIQKTDTNNNNDVKKENIEIYVINNNEIKNENEKMNTPDPKINSPNKTEKIETEIKPEIKPETKPEVKQPEIKTTEPEKKEKFSRVRKKFIEPWEIYELESYVPNALLSDVNSEIIIRLHHDYDLFETYIKFGPETPIQTVKDIVSKLDKSSYTNEKKKAHSYIDEITESFIDSFGNIMIDVMNFKAPFLQSGKIRIKVSLGPYTMPTKTITSGFCFTFNQKFILPKHNRFQKLKINIYKIKEGGMIFKKDTEKLITSYEIPLPNLVNIYYLSKNPIEVKLKPIKEKHKKKEKYSNMGLEFKFYDWSSLLGLAVKNTNKHVLDDYSLYSKDGSSSEPYSISIVLKRIKRVLKMFKDIMSFYHMLQHFKYPILSSIIELCVVLYCFCCNPRYLLTHIIIFIMIIIIYYSSIFQTHALPKIKPILLYYRNKYDTPSLLARTESQKSKEEIAQTDYLTKKSGFSILEIRKIREYKQAYTDLLFRLSRICSTCEKFKNLFLWTDPLLTFYMSTILTLFLLIVWKVEFRFLVCFSISKKFFFGIFYYKNKLINNKEVARIIVKDTYTTWKKEKDKEKEKKEKGNKNKKEKEEKTDKYVRENEKAFQEMMFKTPVDDEKLKNMIKNKLFEHGKIILEDNFFSKMLTISDVIEELGKVEDIIKIKRLSPLFHLTKKNSKIFQKDIDPEDYFGFFIQNIKSDYYMASNGFIVSDDFKNENLIPEFEMKDKFDKNKNATSSAIDKVELEKINEEK